MPELITGRCRGIKPGKGVVHFRIYADQRHWFRVLIYPNRKRMRCAITRHARSVLKDSEVLANGAENWASYSASEMGVNAWCNCWYESGVAQLGDVVFNLEDMSEGIVAHEMAHASIWWAAVAYGRRKNKKKPGYLEQEEMICRTIEEMTNLFYRRFRSRQLG